MTREGDVVTVAAAALIEQSRGAVSIGSAADTGRGRREKVLRERRGEER